VQGTVEELFWIGVCIIIITVGVAGIAAAILE